MIISMLVVWVISNVLLLLFFEEIAQNLIEIFPVLSWSSFIYWLNWSHSARNAINNDFLVERLILTH